MTLKNSSVVLTVLLCGAVAPCLTLSLLAADQPQWGQAWTRNMVSSERNLPESFDPKTGKNIKWVAKIGTESHSTPVIAKGRVFIGTNNGSPRDPKHEGDRGVLMCFDEQTGKLLWQLVVPKREEDKYHDWPNTGLSSPATVEGNHVYVVSSRGEVMCLDIEGMANGNDGPYRDEGVHMVQKPMADSTNQVGRAVLSAPNDASKPARRGEDTTPHRIEPGPLDADIVWLFDLTSGAGIFSHDGAHSSILIHGDYLYLNTGTGVDKTHRKILTPDAPSLVVIDKRNGQLVARDDEHIAPNIFHCTWSSPSLATVNGKPLIFFCAGNGVVYAFETIDSSAASTNHESRTTNVRKLKKVFQFDFDPDAPRENVHRFTTNRREGPSNVYGMPVFHNNRLYVAGGGDLFWGKNEAWLKCIDATKTGDITRSGEVWSYTLDKHVMSTPAIYEGLVFLADCGRKMHCVDAATGKALWTHDIAGEVWASPYVADGKVYLGTRSGSFYVFATSKEKKLLSSLELVTPISATTTAANGVLYLATVTHLYAIQQGARLNTQ